MPKYKYINSISKPINQESSRHTITFYNNWDDIEKARIENVLSTDPFTRIKNTVELIKRVYGYDTMDKLNIPKKLHFK